MANTYRNYEGNNITKTFAIPTSDWISDLHIIVELDADGTRYDVDWVGAYSFNISGPNIEFDVAPASGVKFTLMRDTLGKDRNDVALDYDFTDGSIDTADQKDGAYRHALYQAQEAADLAFRKAALTDNSVLVYDSGSSQWESVPLNLNYDSTTGFFGIGGVHDASYKYRFVGDILIQDGSGEATLTVQHTGGGGSDAATLRLIADSPTIVWNDDDAATDESFMHLGYTAGTLSLASYNDNGTLKNNLMTFGTDGEIGIYNLPTADPSNVGQLWDRNGAVVLSGASRYLYDSGWVTDWGGTTIAAQATGFETLSVTQNSYYPFQVTVWGRDATTPDIVYPINISPQAREDATNTVGIYSYYDTANRRLLFIFQDNALIAEGASAGIRTTVPWGTIDEIRVTIT